MKLKNTLTKMIVFALLAGTLAFVLFCFVQLRTHEAHILVKNTSQENIQTLQVSMCDHALESGGIPPDGWIRFALPMTCESRLFVSVLFASGKRFEQSMEYVSGGFSLDLEWEIRTDEIVTIKYANHPDK